MTNHENKCQTVASADFDGDKAKDYAVFIVKKETKTPKLVAALSRGKQWLLEELPIWGEYIEGCYVKKTRSGTYEHTVTYEFVASSDSGRESITTNNTSVIAGYLDKTSVAYVYEKGKWFYVWVGD